MFNLTCPGKQCVRNDTLSGLTVALALVPEAVAFAFVAGVEPIVGLYGAFLMGLVTALIGGRPGMISGATGATAVVMVSLVSEHGVQYLFAALLLTGVIQVSAGVFRLGKFIRMVPYPVMLGFVNGLAIVIFLAQLQQFQAVDAEGNMAWLTDNTMYIMLGLIALTMFIIHFLPKLTSVVPASLAAIVTITLLVIGLDLDARTVQDVLQDMTGNSEATIAGDLPSFAIPMVPLTLETLYIILPYAFILAAVGLIESLLTLSLIDEITETRGRGNKEAMIGQSMININSGGRGRLSGISAALFLLAFILFASDLIEMIPVAALVGVMFMVVLGTFEWASLRLFGKIPLADMFVGILVTVVTVLTDLAIAVFVGVIVSALVFAWQHAKQMQATSYVDENGIKHYEMKGPLFFGSVHAFHEIFDPKNDPDEIEIDFYDSRVADHSGIEAIDSLADRYERAGKTLHLKHLSKECKELLTKAGDLVEVNLKEDPTYHVADDKLA